MIDNVETSMTVITSPSSNDSSVDGLARFSPITPAALTYEHHVDVCLNTETDAVICTTCKQINEVTNAVHRLSAVSSITSLHLHSFLRRLPHENTTREKIRS
uniref:Uncharacterized protein n=1 Tax=Leptocylindrus danicus TaxID=163516 RepID=A0A7S2NUP7_9STRA